MQPIVLSCSGPDPDPGTNVHVATHTNANFVAYECADAHSNRLPDRESDRASDDGPFADPDRVPVVRPVPMAVVQSLPGPDNAPNSRADVFALARPDKSSHSSPNEGSHHSRSVRAAIVESFTRSDEAPYSSAYGNAVARPHEISHAGPDEVAHASSLGWPDSRSVDSCAVSSALTIADRSPICDSFPGHGNTHTRSLSCPDSGSNDRYSVAAADGIAKSNALSAAFENTDASPNEAALTGSVDSSVQIANSFSECHTDTVADLQSNGYNDTEPVAVSCAEPVAHVVSQLRTHRCSQLRAHVVSQLRAHRFAVSWPIHASLAQSDGPEDCTTQYGGSHSVAYES